MGRAQGIMQPILANRLYMPETYITDKFLRKHFRHVWHEKQYEYVLDEDGLIAINENGRRKRKKIYIEHVIDSHKHLLTGQDTDWIGLPRGDLKGLGKMLSNVVDLRTVNSLDFNLRLKANVIEDDRYDKQKVCVDSWCGKGSGLIVGETGSGKTVMGIDATIRMGQETLIVSKRGEGEGHWEDEFRQHTNINDLEQKLSSRLIGPYRHKSKQYPISIVTVQTFLHEVGYKRLIQDQHRFGLVIADEVHELVAPQFINVFSLWAPLSWLGLTATPKRPDHREYLAYKILGPVVAKLDADQMRPKVEIVETDYYVPDWLEGRVPYPRQWKWTKLLQLLSGFKPRIDLIVKRVMEDIDNGRLVAVVGERSKLLREIHDILQNNGYDVGFADGSVPKAVRKRIYGDMAKGRLQCLCAGKVLDAMVSIKPLDCMHVVTPMAADHRIQQVFGRTRRPQEGKLIPLIRYYADNGGQLSGAARKVVKKCEAEGWEIKRTKRALQASSSMGKWSPKEN